MVNNGKTKRYLEGGAADSPLLILEEVFKSGPAVLDMFLMLLNERVYKEGLVECKAPLRLVMAVSNEWSPEGCETALSAFFDRFLFRKEVKYISKAGGRKQILGKAKRNDKSKAVFEDKITLAEIDQAHREAMDLPLADDAVKAMWSICEALDQEGVLFSDRRLYESVGAIRAAAYLAGAQEVETEHLSILSHVLWDSPLEMPQKCKKVVLKYANPVGYLLNDKKQQAESVIEKCTPKDAKVKLRQIKDEILSMKDHPLKDEALDHVDALFKAACEKEVL
jgi:MoxR-like ATPase